MFRAQHPQYAHFSGFILGLNWSHDLSALYSWSALSTLPRAHLPV